MLHIKARFLKNTFLCILFIILSISKFSGGLEVLKFGCRDENYQIVEYLLLYKPSLSKTYYVKYPDCIGIRKAKYELTSPESVVGHTIQPLFESRKTDTPPSFAVWNDDDKGAGENNDDNFESSASTGHSKGILAFNNVSGFLLSHSFPRLDVEDFYEFPENGVDFAQMAICVTLSGGKKGYKKLLYDILDGLNTFNPNVTKIKVGDDIEDGLQNKLTQLGQISMPRSPEPVMSILEITPSKLFRIHLFSRSKKLDNLNNMQFDAFYKLAKHYKTDMKAQTGNNGGWKSDCKQNYQVENVMMIGIDNESNTWSSSQDQSKWAFGTNVTVVCVGDLNRHPNTTARGGMFFCTRDREMYSVFNLFPKEIEACS